MVSEAEQEKAKIGIKPENEKPREGKVKGG